MNSPFEQHKKAIAELEKTAKQAAEYLRKEQSAMTIKLQATAKKAIDKVEADSMKHIKTAKEGLEKLSQAIAADLARRNKK
jgi:aspartate/methionine/tyrosine aminotransferase